MGHRGRVEWAILGKAPEAASRLDKDEKGVGITDTLGGLQEMTTVSVPGLYKLIMTSRKPQAKRAGSTKRESAPQAARGAFNSRSGGACIVRSARAESAQAFRPPALPFILVGA